VNKWSRPFEWKEAPAGQAGGPAKHRVHHYFAFLSYSHADEADAEWLHRELERFRVPSALVGRLTDSGPIPRRLTPIFRDRHELAAADDLSEEIREVLAHSRCLVVLCSPAAAKSKWTNEEIAVFKKLHPDGCIIAAVVAGEPLASDIPGREEEECFPPALVAKYNRRGKPTGSKIEPLAADLREGKGGRRTGFLKVVAGMLGVGLDDLVQREEIRRQRRLASIAAGSFAGMLVAGGLAVTAIQARDAARDQRREAESLVEFMLGDLREKLEPIGRLDALDGVGSRVLEYYSKQDTAELSDQGLAQRSKALTLMGQIARDRGDLDGAEALYHAALSGTAESIRRSPDDPNRVYNHAQNTFYLAEIGVRRGRLDAAEAHFREYSRLADRMVELEPDSIKWRTEAQFAAANLGFVLYSRREFPEAIQQFARALRTVEAFAAADPAKNDYQTGVADALALIADAQEADGRLAEATKSRERHVALLTRLVQRIGADARSRLILAHRDLGRLYAEQGESDLAFEQFRAAVAQGERLLAIEPTNTRWLDWTQTSRLMLARHSLNQNDIDAAAAQLPPVCDTYERLVAQAPTMALRQAAHRDCLVLRARLSARLGEPRIAAGFANRAVEIARSVKTTDTVDDRFGVAAALRILGDIRASTGNTAGAMSAWTNALSLIPSGVSEKPQETFEHSILLERLGRRTEAAALNKRLTQIGYRESRQGMY
jgi:tetratricopeptide (TPR) repeat protein